MAPREHSDAPVNQTEATPTIDESASTTSEPCPENGVNGESYEEALAFFRAAMQFGEAYEVRVPGKSIGYFNKPETAAGYAVELSRANRQSRNPASGIYVTLNPVDPALAGDRLNAKPEPSKTGAGDANIVRRRLILIDVDPVRAKNEHGKEHKAATDAERDSALVVRDAIRETLTERGWPEPAAVTMSGNGGGLLYRVSLLNDEDGKRLVEGLLRSLHDEFETESVKIDTSVSNAARITKVPGTVSCKGPNTGERPWRVATAEINQDAGVVDGSLLDSDSRSDEDDGGAEQAEASAEAIREALRAKGIGWRERRTSKGGIKLDLATCPTGEHDKSGQTDTTIMVRPNGRRGFECQHDTCKGKTWADCRDALAMGGDDKVAASQQLYDMIDAEGAVLFHDSLGDGYATIPVNGHEETHAINGAGFRQWLRRCYHRKEGKPAGGQAIADVVATMDAYAKFDGPEQEAYVRVGYHAETNRVYLDLANERWEAVEIDADGWRVVTKPPVRFRRPSGLLPLPMPARDGNLERLRDFINDGDNEDNYRLAVSWVVGAFQPDGPYPVLAISGEPGSAKSTTLLILRSIFDPNVAMLRKPPKDEETLIIAAMNSRIVTADNLSRIPRWLSDALCRIATGGGIGKRGLYTNFEEVIVDVKRPVGLTGIGDFAVQSDLLERSLLFKPPALSRTGKKRLTERALSREWEKAHPGILGAVLDGISSAVRNLPTVEGTMDLPRLADFAEWMAAAEEGLGWAPGSFMEAFHNNRGLAQSQSLEASPLYRPLLQLLYKRVPEREAWNPDEPVIDMTPTELYDALDSMVSMQEKHGSKSAWPKAANALGTPLEQVMVDLRDIGIDIDHQRTGRRRSYKVYLRDAYWEMRDKDGPPERPTMPYPLDFSSEVQRQPAFNGNRGSA